MKNRIVPSQTEAIQAAGGMDFLFWKVRLETLGCKVNQAESQGVAAMFADQPFCLASGEEEPHLIVVNTCAVTGRAAAKSRRLIRRLARQWPRSALVVMGCYSQMEESEVESLPGVDLVLGTSGRSRLREMALNLLNGVGNLPGPQMDGFEALPLPLPESRVRVLLKVQDGCQQYCAYCVVPRARGKGRSLPPEAVKDRVTRLVRRGCGELVLTGVNLGTYGRDLDPSLNLETLLQSLDRVSDLPRWRLSSLEPQEVPISLVDYLARSSSFCQHLHLPLQSGSDRVLRSMGRPYGAADFRRLVEYARDRIPDLAITTDVLVGFPGETPRDLDDTLRLLQTVEPMGVHVFSFSLRPGTRAAHMTGQVDAAEKRHRQRLVSRLSYELWQRFARSQQGRVLEVLEEGADPANRGAVGYSRNYLRVVIPGLVPCSGRLTRVVPGEAGNDTPGVLCGVAGHTESNPGE